MSEPEPTTNPENSMLRLCTLISRHDLARLALPVGQCTWRACCPSSSRVHTIEDAAQITFAAATASDWTWQCSVLRRRDHIPWTTKAGRDLLYRRTPGDFPRPTRINDSDDRAGGSVLEVRRGVASQWSTGRRDAALAGGPCGSGGPDAHASDWSPSPAAAVRGPVPAVRRAVPSP
jgi:hypothetical protein